MASVTVSAAPGTTPNSPSNLVRGFSRVVLTSDVFISPDKLTNTPSIQDGLDADTEYDLRNYGCELIQTAGILLKLPQVAMATGQVLFQRYYYSRSFVRHNAEITAIAAVHLASKIEEAPRRIRDCLNVFHHMKQVKTGRTIGPMVLDQNYVNIKNEVIKAERRCLKELGFCVHVKHPHKIIVTILGQLEQKNNQRLAQFAWNYMNDSFRTDVFMRFSPAVIACSCIFLAARQLQVPLPNNPPWYCVFDANDEQVKEIAMTILRLYARPKVAWDKLELAIVEANRRRRDLQIKERLARDMSSAVPSFADEGNSPPMFLPTDAAPSSSAQPQQIESAAPAPTAPPAGEAQKAAPSPPDAYRKRDEDDKKRGGHGSRSRSRSPHARHGKSSSSKHHRDGRHSRHRHRHHSSMSAEDSGSSRNSSRSRSVSSSSSASSHRRGNHLSNGRDANPRKGGKYHGSENGADAKRTGDNKRSSDKNYRRRSRSRSGSRKRDHHREDSSARKTGRGDIRRSPAPRIRDGRHHHGNGSR